MFMVWQLTTHLNGSCHRIPSLLEFIFWSLQFSHTDKSLIIIIFCLICRDFRIIDNFVIRIKYISEGWLLSTFVWYQLGIPTAINFSMCCFFEDSSIPQSLEKNKEIPSAIIYYIWVSTTMKYELFVIIC